MSALKSVLPVYPVAFSKKKGEIPVNQPVAASLNPIFLQAVLSGVDASERPLKYFQVEAGGTKTDAGKIQVKMESNPRTAGNQERLFRTEAARMSFTGMLKLQMPGKKRMPAQQLVHGRMLEVGDVLRKP